MLIKNSENVIEAGSISINEKVDKLKNEGKDVIVLSLGEAFFKIPSIDLNYNLVKGAHYSDSQGLLELRELIANYYQNTFSKNKIEADNLIISAGSKILSYLSILISVENESEVLLHEPYWLSYPEQIKLSSGRVKKIPYWEDPKDFKKFFTNNTKVLIINNPNNPAGSIYKKEDLNNIYEICVERDVQLIIDEAYSEFCEPDSFYSAVNLDKSFKNLIILNSFSKNIGLSGWRIGFAISNHKTINNLKIVNQHLITCAPTILQSCCVKYFDLLINNGKNHINEILFKRKELEKFMDNNNIKYISGSATFYFFVELKSNISSFDFSNMLLNNYSIAVVPGGFYGKSTNKFLRVSIGSESLERIKKALIIIRDLMV